TITYYTAQFTISADTTSLTYTGPTSSMYGQCGAVNLSAVLMDTIHNVPVNGATITFTLGNQTATAVTDATGTANKLLTVNQAPGPVTVKATFAGNSTLAAATTPNISYTINTSTNVGPVPGQVFYSGPLLVWTASSSTNTATATLSATIKDLAGCN